MILPITKVNKEQAELDEAFSTMIRARDNWTCQICGTGFRTCCHHIIPREIKEFRYSEDNAITLCTRHHKFDRAISAHNSPLAFFLWLQRFRPLFFSVAVGRITKQLNNYGIQLT